jgi:hypothetical protein
MKSRGNQKNRPLDWSYANSDLDYYKFTLTDEGYFNAAFDVSSETPQYGWTISILDSKYKVIYKKTRVKRGDIRKHFTLEIGKDKILPVLLYYSEVGTRFLCLLRSILFSFDCFY